jgi:hypothetical protein
MEGFLFIRGRETQNAGDMVRFDSPLVSSLLLRGGGARVIESVLVGWKYVGEECW